jgi:hypothetical protein
MLSTANLASTVDMMRSTVLPARGQKKKVMVVSVGMQDPGQGVPCKRNSSKGIL